jgi:hypothetical protein
MRLDPAFTPGSASKAGLDGGGQAAEEPPRQSGVVGKHDAVRPGDHAAYIAGSRGHDNEWPSFRDGANSAFTRVFDAPWRRARTPYSAAVMVLDSGFAPFGRAPE